MFAAAIDAAIALGDIHLPMILRAESPGISSVLGPPRTRDSRSGAMAMNPSAATWSATPRTHVGSPKISCTTTTTGVLASVGRRIDDPRHERILRAGLPRDLHPLGVAVLALSRAGALLALGGKAHVPCVAEALGAGAAERHVRRRHVRHVIVHRRLVARRDETGDGARAGQNAEGAHKASGVNVVGEQ